jgi:flagellar biosynthesis/type III secretory pathway protein FliH
MIVREPDNLCVICGAVLPEGRQVCPICGTKDDVESCAKLIRTDLPKEDEPLAKAAVETALKIKDECEQAFRQGYLTGFNEGMKSACELKQQNEQLRKDNAILRAAIERRDNENNQDGWYE